MNSIRRVLLQRTGAIAAGLAAGLLQPLAALGAWSKEAFGAKSSADVQKLLGTTDAAPNPGIVIEAPQIAENGSVVPVEISSSIPATTSIAVIIDKNPFPLVGKFDFMEGALPFVKVNVKMGETSNVRAIATAGGKHYVATKEVKVTIGGCGG